jgi:protein phosphatase
LSYVQLAYPMQVHLLRGNHEVLEVNARMYDFLAHCKARLGPRDGKAVHAALNDVFDMMPLAAVVETPPPLLPPGVAEAPPTRVFCVHGGLGRLIFIEDLDALERPLALNIEPSELEGPALAARLLADDALWSDPAACDDDAELEAAGGSEDNARGAGARFGPGVVRAFCARNGVAAVVRAHQVPRAGVEPFAGGLGVTVFSAADYPHTAAECERDGNAAALLWMGRDGRLYPRVLLPAPPPPPPPRAPQSPEEREFSD